MSNAPQTAARPKSPPRFAFMKFVVRDLDAMVAFYETVLGLVVTRKIDVPSALEVVLSPAADDTGFSLVLYHHKDGREISPGTLHGPLAVFVADTDVAYASTLAHGGTSQAAPYTVSGIRVAFVADPEGHALEFLSQPSVAQPSAA